MTTNALQEPDGKAVQKSGLSYKRLHELLEYNPLNGKWRWKIHGKPYNNCSKIWYDGTLNTNGRYYIQIDGKKYLVSRLAFLYVKGHWPEPEIDHRNINKIDNRLMNLREATRIQNQANKKPRNAIGIKGVHFIRTTKRYYSEIKILGKAIYLGTYDTAEEAGWAYDYVARALNSDFAYQQQK